MLLLNFGFKNLFSFILGLGVYDNKRESIWELFNYIIKAQ